MPNNSAGNNGINISNTGKVIGAGIVGNGNIFGENISIADNVVVNKNNYNNLASEFKISLDELLALINKRSEQLSVKQKKSLTEYADYLSKECNGINPNKEIQDECKRDSIKFGLKSMAEKIVEVMPEAA